MTGFQRFGIQRLSPSALNLWNANPGLYALRYLGKFFDDAGPAAWRGNAVEKGLHSWLIRKDAEAALAEAHDAFEKEAQGLADSETEAEHANIAPMLEVAIAHCANLPSPYFGAQTRVEHNVPGLDVPIVGYIDFVFEDGSILDLKTTKRCPSEPKPDHVRQVSLYMAAKDCAGSLLYVTDKRAAQYPITDEMKATAIKSIERDALALQRFLSAMPDALTAISALPVNDSDFRWSEAATKHLESMVSA